MDNNLGEFNLGKSLSKIKNKGLIEDYRSIKNGREGNILKLKVNNQIAIKESKNYKKPNI